MFGSLNMTKYFTPEFITASYDDCVLKKTYLYECTTINPAVVAYDVFYVATLAKFDIDSNYLDPKYKTAVKS